MSVHVHHPNPAVHRSAIAALLATLLVSGAAAGIAWQASGTTSPTPTHPIKYQGPTYRMLHGFTLAQPR
jgi:hypothetical protein